LIITFRNYIAQTAKKNLYTLVRQDTETILAKRQERRLRQDTIATTLNPVQQNTLLAHNFGKREEEKRATRGIN